MPSRTERHLLAELAGHVAGERCSCDAERAPCLPCRARGYADELQARAQASVARALRELGA